MLWLEDRSTGKEGAFDDAYRMRFSSQLATGLLVGYGDGRNGREEGGACAGRGGEVLPAICGTGADWDGGDGELPVVRGVAEKLGHEVWIGDAAKIRASDVRQQKHDKRDAALLLQLLMEGRFPRIWTPSSEQRDLRQLLIHRNKLVRLRAQAKNELQHLAMNRGLQKKNRLWSEEGQKRLRELPLMHWAGRRREDLFKVMALLDTQILSLDLAVKTAAENDPNARLLMSQPGVGPVTSLAFVLTMGDVTRFRARQAGGELPGADSARVQFGRTSAAGTDQQAGESVYENVVGGSGASGGSLRPEVSFGVFASLSHEAEGRGEGGGGEEVGDSTLLDAAHAKAVSGDRFDREQPAGARGRPQG